MNRIPAATASAVLDYLVRAAGRRSRRGRGRRRRRSARREPAGAASAPGDMGRVIGKRGRIAQRRPHRRAGGRRPRRRRGRRRLRRLTAPTPATARGRARSIEAHGLRGEVVVDLVTNRARAGRARVGARDRRRASLHDRDVAAAPAPLRRALRGRRHPRGRPRPCTALVLRGRAPIDDPDELWVHELIGSSVVEVDGDRIGRRHGRWSQDNPASDLLVLDGGALVPLRFVVVQRRADGSSSTRRSVRPLRADHGRPDVRIDVFTIFPEMVDGFAARACSGGPASDGPARRPGARPARGDHRPAPHRRRHARSAAARAW